MTFQEQYGGTVKGAKYSIVVLLGAMGGAYRRVKHANSRTHLEGHSVTREGISTQAGYSPPTIYANIQSTL